MSVKKIVLLIGLFVVVLTSFRLLWIQHHQLPDHPHAERGVVDLSDWKFEGQRPITLDGEWEFFPHEFITSSSKEIESNTYITVPGDWKKQLNSKDSKAAYGYGTYRLKIRLPDTKEELFGIQMKQATSASQIFIDGELISGQNHVVKSNSNASAERGPYKALFHNEADEIELVVHVSNYDLPFFGGIMDSVKIGTAASVIKEHHTSTTLQLIVAIMFLLHSLYAIFIYFAGKLKHQKEVLYFGFLLLLSGISNLIDDDVVLQLPLSIEWSNKLLLLILISVLLVMVKFVKHLYHLEKKSDQYISILYGLLLAAMILTPFHYYFYLIIGLALFYGAGNYYLFKHTIHAVRAGNPSFLFILLFITSYTSNIIWGFGIKFGFSDIPYYPFDFVVMVLAIALLLLNRHIHVVKLNEYQTKELLRADQQKDDFLTNTSHELRNPLHGIINITHTVLTDKNERLSPKNRDNLELLLRIGKQLTFTLNDLIDSTRLSDNSVQLNKEAVNIHNVVSATVDMVGFLKNGKPITLQSKIPESFPEVNADENRVIQILFNLLQNAVKFTDAGTITVCATHNEKEATISVQDTGKGMSNEFQKTIFKRYIQKESGATSSGGVGIGLTICKQLVELQGGTISVESSLENGATFSFTLPLTKSEERPCIPSKAVQVLKSTEYLDPYPILEDSNVVKPHILVVDDVWVNLQVLKSLLQENYTVSVASSGKQALELMEDHGFDLMIIDVMMPNMSGYELTRIVRERFSISELPIVLLTARSKPEDIITGFLSGANDYVAKPMDALSLQARVRALTNLRLAVKEQNRMEAAWLQAQIKPHFLFNTLNTIASLGEVDPERMVKLLNEFGNYLRKSFSVQNTQDLIPLSNELELIKSYLYIEQVRFGDRLQIEWNIDSLDNHQIPPLSIQTIVENAVAHGVMKQISGGTILISIANLEHQFEVMIKDDGIGMNADQLNNLGKETSSGEQGIGLKNTNRRLKKLFGTKLEITSAEGKGTTVKFRVPYKSSRNIE
ncbi:hybrid sensor histidine kinase/response regulator [Sporosarcina aquimarina]|nr:ATP-binding protein [Sporosarcina aquimarina]